MTTKQNRRIKIPMFECKKFIQTRKKTNFFEQYNFKKNFGIICLLKHGLHMKSANPRPLLEIRTVFYQTKDLRCNQHLTVEH